MISPLEINHGLLIKTSPWTCGFHDVEASSKSIRKSPFPFSSKKNRLSAHYGKYVFSYEEADEFFLKILCTHSPHPPFLKHDYDTYHEDIRYCVSTLPPRHSSLQLSSIFLARAKSRNAARTNTMVPPTRGQTMARNR